MCSHPKPHDVELVFVGPGSAWSPDQRRLVRVWLVDVVQLRMLVLIAQANLGRGATSTDAECAVTEFFDKRLDTVMGSYHPARPGAVCFWQFVCFCLRRFCIDRQGRPPRMTLVVHPTDPQPAPPAQSTAKETGAILRQAIDVLSEPYRTVFVLQTLEGLSLQEIAERLNRGRATVGTWAYRARQILQAWLREQYPDWSREVLSDD